MRFRPIISLILLLFLCTSQGWCTRTDSVRVYQGFSGGMLLHTGYLFAPASNTPLPLLGKEDGLRGMTYGIGGALRVHLLEHLRIGGEGFVSTMPSGATSCREQLCSGSYIRSGWGGLGADACWRGENVWPYVGGSFGGGSTRSFYLLEGDESDWEEETHALFHRQPFLYVDPYVGLDWCMTSKVHLTFRLDWMLAFNINHHTSSSSLLYPTGPRLYVGFMFCH